MRYTFRKNKPKFCYHIATERGTICKMENCNAERKLDVITTERPLDRHLCQICAQLAGVPVTKPPACAQIDKGLPSKPKPAAQPFKPSGEIDPLLEKLGITSRPSDADHATITVRLALDKLKERYGVEFRGKSLPYGDARHILKRYLSGSNPKLHILKGAKVKVVAGKPNKAAKPKPIRQPKAHSRLSSERIAYIISDDFLRSWEWRKLRYEALKRSDGRCEVCGRGKTDGVVLHVDHIKSRRLHPELALVLENLQVLDADCNAGKGFKDATNWRDKNAQRVAHQTDTDIPWERLEAF